MSAYTPGRRKSTAKGYVASILSNIYSQIAYWFTQQLVIRLLIIDARARL